MKITPVTFMEAPDPPDDRKGHLQLSIHSEIQDLVVALPQASKTMSRGMTGR